VVESVYSAVRTDCLYEADCVWFLYGYQAAWFVLQLILNIRVSGEMCLVNIAAWK